MVGASFRACRGPKNAPLNRRVVIARAAEARTWRGTPGWTPLVEWGGVGAAFARFWNGGKIRRLTIMIIYSKCTRNTFQSFSTSRAKSSFSIFVVIDGWALRQLTSLSAQTIINYLGRVDAEMGICPKENSYSRNASQDILCFRQGTLDILWIPEYPNTCINIKKQYTTLWSRFDDFFDPAQIFDNFLRCAWSARGYGFPQNPSSFARMLKQTGTTFWYLNNKLDFSPRQDFYEAKIHMGIKQKLDLLPPEAFYEANNHIFTIITFVAIYNYISLFLMFTSSAFFNFHDVYSYHFY